MDIAIVRRGGAAPSTGFDHRTSATPGEASSGWRPVTRKATAVDRPRCVQCRNPIKEHQAAVGPREGDRTFHEDCWTASHPVPAPAAADVPVDAVEVVAVEAVVEQRVPEASPDARVPEPSSEQREYEERIASGGLAALLSPYVSGLPAQRETTESVPA